MNKTEMEKKRERLVKAIEAQERKIVREKEALERAKKRLDDFDKKRLDDVLAKKNMSLVNLIEMIDRQEPDSQENPGKNDIEPKKSAGVNPADEQRKEESKNETD